MRSSNPLAIILDQYRLTDPNFIDWLRNLKFFLAFEKILYVLEQSLLRPLPKNASQKEQMTLKYWKDDDEVGRII